MRARFLTCLILTAVSLWSCEAASARRHRRQVTNNFPNQPPQPKAYQPPLPLGGPPAPVASSAAIQNSYQPPISLIRTNEYQPPQNAYPGNVPRSYQSQPAPGPQSYVLPNQPQSIQYIPPSNLQQSFSVFQQPPQNVAPQPATSFSVHQQPPQSSQGHQASFAILSDNSGLPQTTAERTYSTHSKVVASAHVPAQAIHKAPASEIQPEKGSAAKDKDNKNDEYVVYYYYYYDNDTNANNNLSLNFDDIPSLEAYDNDKLSKEPEKSASARTLSANINSLAPIIKPEKDVSQPTETISSQPRSVGETYARPDRPSVQPLEETLVQPLKPVSNIFRYGSNEVPRFPVLPNFIVTEVPTTTKSEVITPDTLTTESPTTQPAQINAQPDLKSEDVDDDDLNNVLDNTSDIKATDEKLVEEEPTTTTTTTTTELPTTTEEPTTTTEKSRRRPSLGGGGGRRRFNSSPASSFQSNRSRQTPSRSTTTSSSSTTTTTTKAPTRRTFQGSNRVRPRPSIGSNRPRPGSRPTEDNEDKAESKAPESTTTSTTISRSRFTSASPRRFQSGRSRSQASSASSTSTTTKAPKAAVSTASSRSRPPASRPPVNRPSVSRPNPVTRNRPPRPGFLRPRPGSEPEEPETTTAAPVPTEEETSPESTKEELPSTNDESNETEEEEETSEEETEEPTTTERSRFSALFKPRNRNGLGNRPRPVIGNRPSRS